MAASRVRALVPLVLGAMASQALLVVLAPTIVAIGADLGASVATVGRARPVTAAVSITASVAISARADAARVSRLLLAGSAVAACAAVAASRSTTSFLIAHAVVGLAFALLLSGAFAGLAAFAPERRAAATGYVASANAAAWILVNPLAAALTERLSWRAAQAVPAAVAAAVMATAHLATPVPAGRSATGVRALVTVPPARRWLGAETVGYAGWTALLTFAGAYFIQRFGVRESAAGWLLAGGAAAYLVASTRSGALAGRVPRRRLVVGSALVMAALRPRVRGARAAGSALAHRPHPAGAEVLTVGHLARA
ncbi:MFS transporter [Georgenia sp. SYP-B2076]|uniref:MFS transporter n=1 Tax=Georgenia sp. SYP-B2076 TaxID=2495881 RepID=UPI000F8F7882|nr:MFS transporter [Georgenia sp. SYP-B2076]